MPYKAYLIEQFDTTHENIFFKDFSDVLSQKFESDTLNVVLIGNLSVNGNQIDALFIRKGQITVIDFKNYGGKLTFSENNHWSIRNNQNVSLVAGGAYNRNPFQQVNQYRRTLIDYLSNKESEILKGVREDVNWGHISALVLFHQPIEFDKNEIPSRLVYFHITDFKSSTQIIEQIKSNKLRLADSEIENILHQLNISKENLFDQTKIVEDKNDYEEKIKFDLIKRLVKNTPRNRNELHRILSYYKILLDIESYREENKLEQTHQISVNENFSDETITIDYTQNNRIFQELTNNQSQRFPNNVFIGLKFNVGDTNESKIMLYQIILSTEINYNENKNTIKTSNFELYPPAFHELNLPDNLIDELNSKISDKVNLSEKINVLRQELETLNIRHNDKFTLAFSNKNLTNSQLSSELNRLSKNHLSELESGIINSYLQNKPIININNSINNIIKIAPLNHSQSNAVKACFENSLSVITGPPGTGKTQLVLNIIANAIVNDKKILFASKNNKAVDNVIERFVSDYLLRVGSNSIIETQLKPKLNKFTFSDYSFDNSISKQRDILNTIRNRIEDIKTTLHKENTLPTEIKEHNNRMSELKNQYQKYINTINSNEKVLFFDKGYKLNVNQNQVNLDLQKLQKKNSNFISRLFFKLFSQSKQLEKIVNMEETIERDIVDYLNTKSPIFINGQSNLSQIINHLIELVAIYENYVKYNGFKDKNIKNTEFEINQLTKKQKELDWIIANKEQLLNELIAKNDEYVKNSEKYLKQFINNKLSQTSSSTIANFKSYLGNAPWRDDEYIDYEYACNQFIENFLAISVTNLSVKKALSLSKDMFDLLVIDEASQCDIASAIPLIFRAKNVVIIGDPNQLQHITSVKKQYEENYILNYLELSEAKYNYEKISLFDYAKTIAEKSNIETYFLKEHYRCHPKIIEFSNNFFYHNELIINTKEDQFKFGDKGIVWVNIKGKTEKELNYNKAEKDKVISLALELVKKYPDTEIGITTPFKHQQDAIKKEEGKINDKNNKLEIKTIHKFQGDEKDIMILSLVVTKEAKSSLTNFINIWAKYLLNVAVTRAKSTLYIVGDFDFCKNDERNNQKALSKLAEYVELNGKIK